MQVGIENAMASVLRRGALLLLVVVGGTSSLSAQTGEETTWNDVVRVTATSTFEIPAVARMRYTADERRRRSPTVRQMLEVLRGTPRVVLAAQPAESMRLLGRGQFHIEGWRTIGVMEIVVHQDSQLRTRAIAHELAHAVEIACLPPQPDTAALHRTLAKRAGYLNAGPLGVETPFAPAAETAVLREFYKPRDTAGRLPALAAQYDLPGCAGLEAELQVVAN